MTNQTKNEVIKALAYGETPEQIAEERDMLKGAGYIE